jgi:hypothetical protein
MYIVGEITIISTMNYAGPHIPKALNLPSAVHSPISSSCIHDILILMACILAPALIFHIVADNSFLANRVSSDQQGLKSFMICFLVFSQFSYLQVDKAIRYCR